MTGRLADIFNIVGTDTFLRVGNTRIVRHNRTVKIFLSGVTPALVHKRVASSCGTKEADGSILCPLD